MFCNKCGSHVSDGEMFCSSCGTQVDQPITPSKGIDLLKKPLNRNKLVGFLAAGVALVLAIILLVSIFGGRSWKTTANQLLKAAISGSIEDLLYLIPEDLIEYSIEEEGITLSELEDELEDMYDSYDTDDYKLSYKIIGSCPYSESELEDIADEYHDYFDMDRKRIKSATRVVILFSYESTNSDVRTSITTIDLIKIGNKWYLDFSETIERYWW